MKKRCILLLLLFVVLVSSFAAAHEENEEGHGTDVEVVKTGTMLIKIAADILVLATLLLLPFREHLNDTTKKIAFWTITIPIVFSTFFFAGAIVYENAISDTGGPIHWHADYQVVVCGERLNLVDPKFPRNKVGSPLFHEHDDDRIHVEGTVMEVPDISLGEYFEVIGGDLHQGYLKYPAGSGVVEVRDGESCNGRPGRLEVYVNGERISNYEDYFIYPDPYVPPGDCIIVEFDSQDSPTTSRICESWAAQGWSYGNYQRRSTNIGGYEWQ